MISGNANDDKTDTLSPPNVVRHEVRHHSNNPVDNENVGATLESRDIALGLASALLCVLVD